MDIQVIGRHMDITPSLRDYAQEKIGKVGRVIEQEPMTADVVLRHERNPKISNPDVAEVTIFMRGRVIRAQEASVDMYAAIDLASEKLERQMQKYKTRLLDKRENGYVRVKTAPGDSEIRDENAEEVEVEAAGPQIVREKDLEMKPMTQDEALLQLELVDHDFFIYQDADTDCVSVLYRRDDGGCGVIRARF